MIFLNWELSITGRNGNPKVRRKPHVSNGWEQCLLFHQKIHDRLQDAFDGSNVLPMVYSAQTECNMCWWVWEWNCPSKRILLFASSFRRRGGLRIAFNNCYHTLCTVCCVISHFPSNVHNSRPRAVEPKIGKLRRFKLANAANVRSCPAKLSQLLADRSFAEYQTRVGLRSRQPTALWYAYPKFFWYANPGYRTRNRTKYAAVKTGCSRLRWMDAGEMNKMEIEESRC